MEVDPNAVLFFEGSAIGKLDAEQIVAKAWNFERINTLYREYLQFLDARPCPQIGSPQSSEASIGWFRSEHSLWRKAYSLDPFLPRELLPPEYLGQKAHFDLDQEGYYLLGSGAAGSARS